MNLIKLKFDYGTGSATDLEAQEWAQFFGIVKKLGFDCPEDRSLFSLLHVAAALGNEAECKRLLKTVDPNAAGVTELSPLYFALATGNEECAILLADNGADPFAEIQISDSGNTMKWPLMRVVIERGYHRFFEYCIDKKLVDVNASIYGATLLWHAIYYSNRSAVDFLMKEKASLFPLITNPLEFRKMIGIPDSGEIPFFYESILDLAATKDKDLYIHLRQKWISCSSSEEAGHLKSALYAKNFPMIEHLASILDLDLPTHVEDCLELAIFLNDGSFVFLCTQLGKRRESIPHFMRCLDNAVLLANREAVGWLLSHLDLQNPLLNMSKSLRPALHTDEELFCFMCDQLKKRGDASWLDPELLSRAATWGRSSSIKYLLEEGSDPKKILGNGKTALMLARQRMNGKAFLNAESYALLKKMDENYTPDVKKVVLFGHRFSMEGLFFEGFASHRMFYRAILKTAIPYLNDVRYPHVKKMEEILTSAIDPSLDSVLKRYDNNEWVLIPAGWWKHKIVCFACKKSRIFGTGQFASGLELAPGLRFYEMENEKEAPAVLGKLTEMRINGSPDNGRAHMNWFEEEMHRQLGLKEIGYLADSQEVGNCQEAAARGGFLALLILLGEESWTREKLDGAMDKMIPLFAEWFNLDVRASLPELKDVLARRPDLVDRVETLSQLLQKSVCKGQLMTIYNILELWPDMRDWKNPATSKILNEEAFDRKWMCLYNHLLSMGAEEVHEWDDALDIAGIDN